MFDFFCCGITGNIVASVPLRFASIMRFFCFLVRKTGMIDISMRQRFASVGEGCGSINESFSAFCCGKRASSSRQGVRGSLWCDAPLFNQPGAASQGLVSRARSDRT